MKPVLVSVRVTDSEPTKLKFLLLDSFLNKLSEFRNPALSHLEKPLALYGCEISGSEQAISANLSLKSYHSEWYVCHQTELCMKA